MGFSSDKVTVRGDDRMDKDGIYDIAIEHDGYPLAFVVFKNRWLDSAEIHLDARVPFDQIAVARHFIDAMESQMWAKVQREASRLGLFFNFKACRRTSSV